MAGNHCPQCGEAVSGADRFCAACGTTLAEAGPAEGGSGSKLPLVILALAAIGVLLIAGGLFLDGDDAPVGDAPPPAVPATARADAEIPFPEVPRIALTDAVTRQMNGEAIFVDVRDGADFAEGHIPEARSIPLGDTALDPAYEELATDVEIITYCT